MKKIYQTPITNCVKIELQQMIALSTGGTTDSIEGNLSREFDFFEDSHLDISDDDLFDWEEF